MISTDKIMAVAHRGGKSGHIENTLGAFLHAANNQVEAVEMDIRLDRINKRFFLEHDLIHHPNAKKNTVDSVVPNLPRETTLFVEIKTINWFTPYYARIFKANYDKYFNKEKTVVISFNPFILIRLKRICPDIKVGFLCGNPFWLLMFRLGLYRFMKPYMILYHKRLLTKDNVDFGKKHNLLVWAFVLNKAKSWKKAIKLGVNGITTDYPKELMEFIKTQS